MISAVALVWNLLGGVNFAVQMLADDLSGFPEWWLLVVETRPWWATAGMVVGVFGGLFGCVLLLLRRRLALPLFIASLVGVAMTMSHAFGVGEPGAQQVFEGIIMPFAVGVFLIWYARFSVKKGWLR